MNALLGFKALRLLPTPNRILSRNLLSGLKGLGHRNETSPAGTEQPVARHVSAGQD
jgi:hypothetical protein